MTWIGQALGIIYHYLKRRNVYTLGTISVGSNNDNDNIHGTTSAVVMNRNNIFSWDIKRAVVQHGQHQQC